MFPESPTFQVDNAGCKYLNKLTVHCHCSNRVPQLKEELLVQILLMVIDNVIFPVQNHPIRNNSNFSVFKTSRVFILIITVLIVSKSLCKTCSAAWTTPTSCLFDTLGNTVSQAEWTYFSDGFI